MAEGFANIKETNRSSVVIPELQNTAPDLQPTLTQHFFINKKIACTYSVMVAAKYKKAASATISGLRLELINWSLPNKF